MKYLEKFLTRKFVAATFTASLMFCAWVLSQWLPGAREYLPGLFTGLVGALSAYTAGNIAQDHLFTKSSQASTVKAVERVADFVLPKPYDK
jgi:hypothetical protein